MKATASRTWLGLAWTVSGNAADGKWDRGVPYGSGSRDDPPAEGDGTGPCVVTDNVAGNSHVDDGNTVLPSAVFDPSAESGHDIILSYCRWFNNSFGAAPAEDVFLTEISNAEEQLGSTWKLS